MKALIGFASVAAVLAAVLLLHGVGSSSSASPFSISAAMAAAKCPDITDTNTHPLPYGALPTASLDPRTCAIDFGIPAGAPGAAGAQGIAGTPGKNGMSGYELKTKKKSTLVTVNNTRSNSFRLSATAPCPPPLKAIGGGASVTTDGGSSFPITASEPTPNGQGWTADAKPLPPGAFPRGVLTMRIALKVTAICAKVTP